MTDDMHLGMKMVLRTELEMSQYWDRTLLQGPENPFPLAPRDWVKDGRVTEESYREENRLLTRFVHQTMWDELRQWRLRGLGTGHIEVLGCGLMRDLTWLPAAVKEFGFSASIRDLSKVACDNAREFLRHYRLVLKVPVTQTEVERGLQTGEIDDERTTWFYGGQFLQNQNDEAAARILRRFGGFLSQPGPRRVYLLHARGEDNKKSRVVWRNTTPYYDAYLRAHIEQGLESRTEMEPIGKHHYFHQRYTLFRITAAGQSD